MNPYIHTDDFELFVSYAQSDNRGEYEGVVSTIVEGLQAAYERLTHTRLRAFFDRVSIQSMDDWEAQILKAISRSRVMLAVLSPAYFASTFCRREWEAYVQTELERALPGEGIAPIYIVSHSDIDRDDPLQD